MPSETARRVPAEPEAGGGRPTFVLARDFGQRADEINRFYNDYTHRTRSLEAYRWEWQAGAEGPGLVWTISEASSQRLVGHHGIVRIPLVRRGQRMAGGRTENTIIEPSVRKRLFYPAMEKRALGEALQALDVIYTVFASGAHAKVRARLGYAVVGRWVAYLPRYRSAYLTAVLQKARQRLSLPVPDALLRAAASIGALGSALGPGAAALDVEEIADLTTIRDEYEVFWTHARRSYPLSIDRSFDFLRWRIVDNPHVKYRTWALRQHGRLYAVVIGHRQCVGMASALEVDDLIAREYSDAAFDAVVRALRAIDSTADAIVVRTLALGTPLHRALRRRLPMQAFVLQRWGGRFFEDLMAHDRNALSGGEPWYVTPLFTEGLGPRSPVAS